MVTKNFTVHQPDIKSITDEEGTIYITGIANTGERDLVGDIVTEDALQQICDQATQRNLHFNHNGNWDESLEDLTESIIGVITESTLVSEGVSIKARILPKHSDNIKYLLENDVKLGLSIAGRAHYEENSYENIESWELTEISLTPTPCDQGTMGTVELSKSFTEAIRKLENEDKKTDEGDNTMTEDSITKEDVISIVNDAFNEEKEALIEEVGGAIRDEYEAVITELKERIETIESKLEEPQNDDDEDNDDAPDEGDAGKTTTPPEQKSITEDEVNTLVKTEVNKIIKGLFNPDFKYEDPEVKKEEDKVEKKSTMTSHELAEKLLGGQ